MIERVIGEAAMGVLYEYAWPGNVRQLETEIGIALWNSGVQRGGGVVIEPRHLAPKLLSAERRGGRPRKVSDVGATSLVQEDVDTSEAARRLRVSRRTVQRRVRGKGDGRPKPDGDITALLGT